MNALLWTLVAVGGWNLLNAVARLLYRERQSYQHWPYIGLGFWAAYLLLVK